MSNIKFDPNNCRIHTERNERIIEKSLQDCGAGRSILIDNDDMMIAGEGVYKRAQKLGIPVRVIESDGKELIAVKRKDLRQGDKKRKDLAFADNHASDTSMFDMDIVLEEFSAEELELWEFEVDDVELGLLNDLTENEFMNNVKSSSETFDFTLTLPKKNKEQVDLYVKENTKAPLVELLLKYIENA